MYALYANEHSVRISLAYDETTELTLKDKDATHCAFDLSAFCLETDFLNIFIYDLSTSEKVKFCYCQGR